MALDLPITTSESNAGLTPPAVAYALLGKGGAILIIIIVFMVRASLLRGLRAIFAESSFVHLISHLKLGALCCVALQAVTSSGSAEQIAVSSLMTYDLYNTYINPKATPKQLIMVRPSDAWSPRSSHMSATDPMPIVRPTEQHAFVTVNVMVCCRSVALWWCCMG